MGIRFRKSIKVGGMRVNLSKSGVGYSVGGKGFRVTKKAGGGTRTTVSIPGTGISHVTETSKKTAKALNPSTPVAVASQSNDTNVTTAPKTRYALIATLFLVCGILFMQSIPMLSLVSYILGIVYMVKWIKRAKKTTPPIEAADAIPSIEDQSDVNE